MRSRFITCFLITIVSVSLFACVGSRAPKVHWICSTESQPWQEMPTPKTASVEDPNAVALTIDPSVKHQKIIGFGGCFNELGWQALQVLDEPQRDEVLAALFAPSGCNFSACREGMGANDFAVAWYSFDETPGDYAMDHFTIAEDRKTLIPFIKAAMQYQPKLELWGVPWSPPSWMKTNGQYKGGRMKQDAQTLAAYALYFSKYAQAYLHEGIPLRAVMPQNEPLYNDANYPQCQWSGQELNTFLRDYLVPQIKKGQVPVEVWLGTIPSGNIRDFTDPVFGDPVTNPSITGVGYQYNGQGTMSATHQSYPDKLILQTETECFGGNDSWSEGMTTFGRIIEDTNHFCNGYMFWNMILSEKKTSSWGWRQNSLVVVDSQTKKVTYNPEFYAMKHFGNRVLPEAVRVEISQSASLKATALQNPSGEVVVLFSNASDHAVEAQLKLGDFAGQIEVPPYSMNSVSFLP